MHVRAQVGGKIAAQLGSRMIDGVAKKTADQFSEFRRGGIVACSDCLRCENLVTMLALEWRDNVRPRVPQSERPRLEL